jgi:uncharacterized membrane protein YhaH (DUF805 family)
MVGYFVFFLIYIIWLLSQFFQPSTVDLFEDEGSSPLPAHPINILRIFLLIFMIPFLSLLMRRFNDLNINKYLALLGIPFLTLIPILPLLSIPFLFLNSKNSASLDAANEINIYNDISLKDNPIIGFRPLRLLKWLLILFVSPIILFLFLIIIS